jgi:hypothetical protein
VPDLVSGAVAVEPALDEAGRAGEPAELSMSTRDGGRFELRFSAPGDVGALVEAALSEARDALFQVGAGQVTWADALVEVCARSVGSVVSRSRQDAFRVYVHLDAEGGWLTGRPRLPGHLVAKLTCAGTVQPLWHQAGVPVSVGRALRIVPERTRRLVLDRDRGCRFPGCVARSRLEVHHVVHWADGGGTDLDNLVGLCPFHHDEHHRGEFSITGDANRPGGLGFATRGGCMIRPGPVYAPAPLGSRLTPVCAPESQAASGAASDSVSEPGSGSPWGPGLPAGSRCTIGIPTDAPDGPDGLDPANELNDRRDLGYPDEDADSGPDAAEELWPGVAPPVAYQGATGEVLHSKWVTFHEGPALLL